MPQKLTQEEFIEKARNVHADKYDYSKVEYVNSQTKVCIICPEHGEFWQTPNKHLQGHNCPKCAQLERNAKKTFKQIEFENRARSIHGMKYIYNADYKNITTKIKIICPIHGEFWQMPQKHLKGQGCPKCAIEKNKESQKLTHEDFINKAKLIHNDKYDYKKSTYDGYKTKLCIICPEHGEFWQSPDSHLSGHGCPKCGNQISVGENELGQIISNMTDSNIEIRNKDIIPPYELDIYIPSKNIAIEFDGLIWHSERFGKDRNYHLNKTVECEKRGIRLIHVFEDEWLCKRDIVISKLRHIIGDNIGLTKIFARKCDIKEINCNTARSFLDKNHIQGFVGSSVYLGCFYKNVLVGVMSFKREKIGSNKWELTRFASDNNYVCCGVGGKLFKYFVKNYGPSEIKSFADRRWSTILRTTIYDLLGFKLEKTLKPDYYYINNSGKRLHKFSCRKQRIIGKSENLNMSMKETEMTRQLNLYRIWNCGLLKYVWKQIK